MNKHRKILVLALSVLLGAVSATCKSPPSPYSMAHPETFCGSPDPGELKRLGFSESDRKDVCEFVKQKAGYVIVLVAQSHLDIYDFPMIEVHMAPASDALATSGPAYFYWKRSGEWSEVGEMSSWQRKGDPQQRHAAQPVLAD